jgi:hypothetical protein
VVLILLFGKNLLLPNFQGFLFPFLSHLVPFWTTLPLGKWENYFVENGEMGRMKGRRRAAAQWGRIAP